MPAQRVVLVTGGGSGIGRACAVGFSGQGDAVVIAGRRKHALDETRDLCGSSQDVLAIPTDVTNEESVRRLFRTIESACGRVDVVFNNAGTSLPPTPIEETSLDAWRGLVEANLTSQFLVARQAVVLMKRQLPTGGRIISNSSISADVPRPRSAAYTATKHAVDGLTKSIALEGRGHRIACGQIKIGNAATAMASAMPAGVLQADGTVASEPVIDVKHVVTAVLYMASLPLEVNVLSMTVMATDMPFVGRG